MLLVWTIKMCLVDIFCFFFFMQKTAYEMRISDWSSDVCSSDLTAHRDEVVGRIDGHRIAVLPQVIGIALAAAALGALVERRGLGRIGGLGLAERQEQQDRKSTRLNSSH